jgi:hypothetical protein
MKRTQLSGLAIGSLLAIVLATAFGQGVRGATRQDATSVYPAQVEVSPSPDPTSSPTPRPDATPTPTLEPTPSPSFFSFSIPLVVTVIEPGINLQHMGRSLEGWRIEVAVEGATVSGAQPVTDAPQEGDIAEAWFDIEVMQPTIGVAVTAIPHPGYSPVRATCGHVSRIDDERIPTTFEGNTITFTHEPDPDFDTLICFFTYAGPPPPPSQSVGPALPPTDTDVGGQGAGPHGSEHLGLALLAGVIAGTLYLVGRFRR